jgi:alkylation response protein AidB-like acyl-CoA dehydrogenase
VNLADTPPEAEFRATLREWLAHELPTLPPEPTAINDWSARRAYDTGWQRRLFDAGYAGVSWPAEYGGRGSSPAEELIFLEETERAGAPYVGCNFVGTLHAGPTIAAEGTPEQRAAHLPGILRGEHVWCQGFSEPESGSDLASLRCRAERDGDHYVVTGQKIWTSHGHVADFCELLIRTDPESKHGGITWVIMPMDSPGIELRPLTTITGAAEFNEMFLDEVRIPVANRVGAENDGWRVAMVTFSFERGTAFVSELRRSMRLLADLVAEAKRVGLWSADASIRGDLALVSAHQAQRVEGQPGRRRRRRIGVQAGVSPHAGADGGDGAAHPRADRSGDGRAGRGADLRPVAVHRRRHRPDPAQHHRRAPARPPQGALSVGRAASRACERAGGM